MDRGRVPTVYEIPDLGVTPSQPGSGTTDTRPAALLAIMRAMHPSELTAAQQQANQRFVDVAAKIRTDVSRDMIDAYLTALANVTFFSPVNESEGGVEVYVTHFGGDATPLVPVFTSLDAYRAFETVVPSRFRASTMSSVAMCQMVVECFPPAATLAIDPAQPGFLRVPPDLIRVVASAEWQPTN